MRGVQAECATERTSVPLRSFLEPEFQSSTTMRIITMRSVNF